MCGASTPKLGETAIPPFVVIYYLALLAAVLVGWFKGGHSERLAAAAILSVFALSALLPHDRLWNVDIVDALLDLGLAIIFAWQALTGNRWWPLAATAVLLLTMMVHIAMFAVPTMTVYSDLSARIGLGILLGVTVLAGVVERWLAGERPAGANARWRSRKPA
jgi:hypothetical protein